jgi:hypothetical protein
MRDFRWPIAKSTAGTVDVSMDEGAWMVDGVLMEME